MKNIPHIVSLLIILLLGISFLSLNSCNEDEDAITSETVKDIDGNIYHTVKIGTQVWMVENLKTTKFNDGTDIPNITNNIEWEGYIGLGYPAYCDYENTASNSNTYGRLYNWHSITNVKSICPTGWHIPSDSEWETLSAFLGGGSVAGGKLKETGTAHWISPNTGATNSSGFTALPAGSRQFGVGTFGALGENTVFWSSTSIDEEMAWLRWIYYDNSGFGRIGFGKAGYSVRCVKD
jgi:uncharacterized protein (TIGR02145 family)